MINETIREVIVVEGKQDVIAVKKAVQADLIITGGFALNKYALEKIKIAYDKRGIIILTDPDVAGERIRKYLTKLFPEAKQAFVPRIDATANNDVGIEQASAEAIRLALSKVRTHIMDIKIIFSQQDMIENDLSGSANASIRREKLGALLGLGWANGKQFLQRLNSYGVTREEFMEALVKLEGEKMV